MPENTTYAGDLGQRVSKPQNFFLWHEGRETDSLTECYSMGKTKSKLFLSMVEIVQESLTWMDQQHWEFIMRNL